jgi:hypothetical protein
MKSKNDFFILENLFQVRKNTSKVYSADQIAKYRDER